MIFKCKSCGAECVSRALPSFCFCFSGAGFEQIDFSEASPVSQSWDGLISLDDDAAMDFCQRLAEDAFESDGDT